ncbi:hypothetical protein ADIWIN_3209 [Winogradskyella psychrotolerans RS-3]|uniref:Uncharacterized protein n=1 Tax=Winogradskyella psychrotolerans RS-3 TaxID=641526 RepID=S7WX07_9FLAO|nr:hypothetical protein ADIWIN_3209 [Winogradskyella psychrotolerans RS-3]
MLFLGAGVFFFYTDGIEIDLTTKNTEIPLTSLASPSENGKTFLK